MVLLILTSSGLSALPVNVLTVVSVVVLVVVPEYEEYVPVVVEAVLDVESIFAVATGACPFSTTSLSP